MLQFIAVSGCFLTGAEGTAIAFQDTMDDLACGGHPWQQHLQVLVIAPVRQNATLFHLGFDRIQDLEGNDFFTYFSNYFMGEKLTLFSLCIMDGTVSPTVSGEFDRLHSLDDLTELV